METTNKILEIAFSGFWQFCGMAILLNGLFYFTINGLLRFWSRFLRMLMVRKHGWPPSHLDADGDFKVIEKQ
jgi:hypothetical protein